MKQEVYFKKNLEFLTTHTLITQSELSRLLGISRQAIHNLINKDADVRLNTVLKIADIYNLQASDILFVDLELKLKNKKIGKCIRKMRILQMRRNLKYQKNQL